MAKYILEEYVFNGYNASSKAREDVSKIVLEAGFESFATNDKRASKNTKLSKIISASMIYLKILFYLGKDDLIFLQTSAAILDGVLKIKKIKQFKVIYLIHDIFSLRYDDIVLHKAEIKADILRLNQCEYVICHNSQMKEKLVKTGCTSELLELQIFDYLVEDASLEVIERDYGHTVAFAGNLSKSEFLNELDARKIEEVNFNIYGKPEMQFSNLKYCGSVAAEKLPSVINGSYGLIWEGGYYVSELDNYTRFNNPHKASLYIVSGLPLIVWGKSAIAEFVKKYDIGICIDSLDELEKTIENVNDKEYEEMQQKCLEIREKLIAGYYLKYALSFIE